MKTYKAENYFHEGLEFAVRHETDCSTEFNVSRRFKREFWKITFIVQGSGRVVINDRMYSIGANSIYLIHPDSETTYDMDSDSLELYNILFSRRFVERELHSLRDIYQFFTIFSMAFNQSGNTSIYVQKSTAEIKRRVLEIADEYELRRINYRPYLEYSLALLLIQMLRESEKTFRGSDAKAMISEYIIHLLQSDVYGETGTLHLAKMFGITPNHLCAVFKSSTGMTISQARIKTRLDVAAELLATTDLPIHEVYLKCGFHDLSYFYRAFRKYSGTSPCRFRKKSGRD